MILYKRLDDAWVKAADLGEVRAVFARFNVVDSDGDVTRPDAFTDGAEVPISAYGHASWSGALPVGKGRIRADGAAAWVDARFFLTTEAGRDTFAVVKELGELGQWSYGYDPVQVSFGEYDGRPVRFLERLKVHEVSPVLVGAGVGTRTLDAKDHHDVRRIRDELAAAERRLVDREFARYVAAGLRGVVL